MKFQKFKEPKKKNYLIASIYARCSVIGTRNFVRTIYFGSQMDAVSAQVTRVVGHEKCSETLSVDSLPVPIPERSRKISFFILRSQLTNTDARVKFSVHKQSVTEI